MTVSDYGTARTESCARKHRERSCLQDPAFGSQLLYIHILPNSASISPLDSHTSQKNCIYIKTRGFKPFRDTYLQSGISQGLLNHILTKNRVGGGGYAYFRLSTVNCQPRAVTGLLVTSHESPVTASMRYNLPRHTGAKENDR